MSFDDEYMGKPLGEMSADELREAVRELARQLDDDRVKHHNELLTVSAVRRELYPRIAR